MSIVNNANKLSIIIQAITGLFGLYGLIIPLKGKDIILRQVLGLEMIVQIIEFVFYLGFLSIFSLTDLTRKRYYDWFLSTPVMLFTISLYFFYVNFIENSNENKEITINEFTKNNIFEISGIVILNFAMLLFGYLAELGLMNRWLAFILGSLGLCGSFGIIYKSFAKYSNKTKNIFWVMFGIWSLYGIAFLYPPVIKNLGYTTLDIFSKNFFGIFLYYIINTKRV